MPSSGTLILTLGQPHAGNYLHKGLEMDLPQFTEGQLQSRGKGRLDDLNPELFANLNPGASAQLVHFRGLLVCFLQCEGKADGELLQVLVSEPSTCRVLANVSQQEGNPGVPHPCPNTLEVRQFHEV